MPSVETGMTALGQDELQLYLPFFRPEEDVQIGEWVLVTPMRRDALLNPLIAMWERGCPSGERPIPPRYTLAQFIALTKPCSSSLVVDGGPSPSPPPLAPLSLARRHLCRRKRPRTLATAGEGDLARELDPIVLFLMVRVGLLTASTPPVFGGSRIVDLVSIVSGTTKVVNLRWDVQTLCVEQGTATIPTTLESSCPDTQRWIAEMSQSAETEWDQHQRSVQRQWEAKRSAKSSHMRYIMCPFPFAAGPSLDAVHRRPS